MVCIFCGESDPFIWRKDAAEAMAAEWHAASMMDRGLIRQMTLARHDPARFRERVISLLGLGDEP